MPPGLVSNVVIPRVPKLKPLHETRKRLVPHFHQQVDVGWHERIGAKNKIKNLFVFSQQSQIELEIFLPPEDSLPFVPPYNHMIKCSREMNSWFPRHNGILPTKEWLVNT
jgi:hypothetical protein